MKRNDCSTVANELDIHIKQAQSDLEFLREANKKLEGICRNATKLAAFSHENAISADKESGNDNVNEILNNLYTEKIRLFKKITSSL